MMALVSGDKDEAETVESVFAAARDAEVTAEEMAVAMGVDPCQLLRWRQERGAPNGGAMLSLVRLAIRSPDGLRELLDEDVIVIFKPRRRDYGN